MPARTMSPLASFKRLHFTARAAADRCLAPQGLSVAQFGVLRVLADEPGRPGAELARRTSVTAPTMNEMLAMLLRDGLVTRTPDPRGGRSIQMFISPDGRRALDRGIPVLSELSGQLLEGIDADRLAAFFEVLDLVAERAEAYGRSEPA